MMPRRIFTMEVEGSTVVGTEHVARTAAPAGVVFFNFGYVPRDGHGGLAVNACDRLAQAGVPAFRVDLPGLGDSTGELPKEPAHWFAKVRDGGLVKPTLEIVDRIRERSGLETIVVGGLCAASITTIYASACAPKKIGGLVLLEPEMHTADTTPEGRTLEDAPPSSVRERARYMARKAFSYWSWARLATGESTYSRMLPIPRWMLVKMLEIERKRLPELTNVPLVAAWQNVVRTQTPTLVVTAQGKMRELFFDRINSIAVPEYPTRNIEHFRVPHTNHIFTTGGAISVVSDLVSRWVARHYL
jgi:hypothetical protein